MFICIITCKEIEIHSDIIARTPLTVSVRKFNGLSRLPLRSDRFIDWKIKRVFRQSYTLNETFKVVLSFHYF